MTEAENNTVLEINKTVEQMLAQGQWQDALDFWINNTDSLTLIKWLAQFISQSSSEEDSVLLQSIVKWKEGDEEQRWEIFKNSESAGFSSQTGVLGLSLFVSQGSLSPAPYEPVHAPSCSVKKIIYGVLMTQSCKAHDTPDEGVFFLFQHWCNSQP
ncbi:type VI secretion protein [Escherichia coli]|nr:type VI secretion protein [Escherichia coli]